MNVLEAARSNRQLRRRRGRSDPVDAEAAARAALLGQTLGTPKSQDGPVESLRLIRSERKSAIKSRTQAANQVQAALVSAPKALRRRFKVGVTVRTIVDTMSKFRLAGPCSSLEATARSVVRGLAKR